MSSEDLQRITGPGAKDAFGKGNVNVGDGGVAFVLASAGAIPGGAPLVCISFDQDSDSALPVCERLVCSDRVCAPDHSVRC